NDRSFTCPAEGCGKSFYVLQRLKVHMRTHNGERPFLCPETGCGKQFTTAGNLKNHLRIHTGEKPFVCEMEGCGRSFAEYSSLRKHQVVHSENSRMEEHLQLSEDALQDSSLLSVSSDRHSYEEDVSILLS
ncbi:hypothetical protein AB205_0109620, partial [Aquarana catesbeiana]